MSIRSVCLAVSFIVLCLGIILDASWANKAAGSEHKQMMIRFFIGLSAQAARTVSDQVLEMVLPDQGSIYDFLEAGQLLA